MCVMRCDTMLEEVDAVGPVLTHYSFDFLKKFTSGQPRKVDIYGPQAHPIILTSTWFIIVVCAFTSASGTIRWATTSIRVMLLHSPRYTREMVGRSISTTNQSNGKNSRCDNDFLRGRTGHLRDTLSGKLTGQYQLRMRAYTPRAPCKRYYLVSMLPSLPNRT